MLKTPNLLIMPASGEERKLFGLTPEEMVMAISRDKAAKVAEERPKTDIIIGADTIVEMDGDVFGKPKTEDEAFYMLSKLSGCTHRVFTGVTIIKGEAVFSEAEVSGVTFRPLADAEILNYIKTGEPMDKAGAYGIQGLGSLLVERIDGDFYNVMGLPLCRLHKMLCKLGVNLI